jgi:hypothetical protein
VVVNARAPVDRDADPAARARSHHQRRACARGRLNRALCGFQLDGGRHTAAREHRRRSLDHHGANGVRPWRRKLQHRSAASRSSVRLLSVSLTAAAGMLIGANNICFHPVRCIECSSVLSHSACSQGYPGNAFRVEGTGGFNNVITGYNLAAVTYHSLTVTADGYGNFNFTIVDGGNAANVYIAGWSNPASVGGLIGIRRSGGQGAVITDRVTFSPLGKSQRAAARALAQ